MFKKDDVPYPLPFGQDYAAILMEGDQAGIAVRPPLLIALL